jgi:hypothetical protein
MEKEFLELAGHGLQKGNYMAGWTRAVQFLESRGVEAIEEK